MVHILNNYAPLDTDRSVKCTNGLESKWDKYQREASSYIDEKRMEPVQALFEVVKENTRYLLNNFWDKPLQLYWETVMQYSNKLTPTMVLPEWVSHFICYDNVTKKLIHRHALLTALSSIQNYPRGITLYLCTDYNLSVTHDEIEKSISNSIPTPS